MRCHNNLSILLIRLLLLFSNRIFFISFSSFLNVRLLKTYQISAFHLFRMSFPPHILVFSAKKPTKSSLFIDFSRSFPSFLPLITHFSRSKDLLNSLLQSSPNLCVNSSFSYVVLSTLLLSSKDLTEWSLVYHSTLSYQRFYDLHSIHYDHLEGLHQLI